MDFCDKVLAHIPRATPKEREAIRAELEGHLEDRREALLTSGMEEEQAVREAEAAMGDPAEIGEGFNELLSPFWLWVGRSAWLALVCALLILWVSLPGLSHLIQAVAVRAVPSVVFDLWIDQWNSRYSSVNMALKEDGYTLRENVDIRMPLGNGELRVCRLYLDPTPGNTRLAVAMVLYDRELMGYASDDLYYVEIQDQWWDRYSETGEAVAYTLRYNIPVEPGDTYVTLCYERYGEQKTLTIPLPWEVTP